MSFKRATCLTREAAGRPITRQSLSAHCQPIQRFIRYNQQLAVFFELVLGMGRSTVLVYCLDF